MSKNSIKTITIWTVAATGLALAMACSSDSPTAPQQTPTPAPGTTPSTAWNIAVTTDVSVASVGATEPINVEIRVRRADNGQNPANGTTIVISTTLGEFQAIGSGLTSIVASLSNGRASALLFPGTIEGSAVITAQLESSAGQRSVQILEGLMADFDFQNTEDNLSIQFRDLSLGNPNRFFWEFGDGQTSREQHPAHLYAVPGDYVVTLSITKADLTDSTTSLVNVGEPLFIDDIDPNIGGPGNRVTIKGTGFFEPLRVFFADTFAEVLDVNSSRTRIEVVVPFIADESYATEPCELDDGMGGVISGSFPVNTLITVRVESINGRSDSVDNAFIIIPPDPTCRADEGGGDDGGGGA